MTGGFVKWRWEAAAARCWCLLPLATHRMSSALAPWAQLRDGTGAWTSPLAVAVVAQLSLWPVASLRSPKFPHL